ncbi:MAG: VWA domain-containing protein [Anaerolineae bacterium]
MRRLLVAALAMAAVVLLAGWTDLLHLVALAVGLLVLALVALAIGVARRRGAPEPMELDPEAETNLAPTLLRDGLLGLTLAGLTVGLAALIYSHALPPFYPLLVGDCPQLLPRLAIYEDAQAWSKAIALIETRLSQPLDAACKAQLAERKCRYLIAWSKQLPPREAEERLKEAEAWAQVKGLENYRTIARLMRQDLQPTATPPPSTPVLVTPTPQPTPTPRPLAPGATAQISGIDATYFPPTLFAYLRVSDAAGQPIADLRESDVRIEDDGRPITNYTLSHFSQSPASLCVALVIDYSGSMEGEPLAAAKAGARAFLGLLGPRDQVAIIGFNDRPQLLQSWTADKQTAGAALEALPARDWTALWDALYQAGGELAGCAGRKVIVLLSDGADNRSQHTQQQVVEQARRLGLGVFVIGLRTGDYDGATLQRLVQQVGGRYAETTSPQELEEYYRQVAGAIRNEYRLAIHLERQPAAGVHQLRVLIGGPQPLVLEQTYQDAGP